MAPTSRQSTDRARRLAANQHGVVSRRQLLALGFSGEAIEHRRRTRRLHMVHRGVYAWGREQLSRHGVWMAAVLCGGDAAVLSHRSAAELWGVLPPASGAIHLSVPGLRSRRRRDILIHGRAALESAEITRRDRIPVTRPATTLVDLAASLEVARLERAVNEADRLHLIDPEGLRRSIATMGRRPGLRVLRTTLDRRTFALTASELERLFLPLTDAAGLPPPTTGAEINGFKVDFFWPALGLVVETDGLRYHRTPAQQARDRERDQEHSAAGLTPLRFTHAQVRFEADRVVRVLREVADRLA